MSPRAQHPLPKSFVYQQTDVPVGMTLAEYRRTRPPRRPPRITDRLRRALRLGRTVMHGTVYLLHLEPGLPVTGSRGAAGRCS